MISLQDVKQALHKTIETSSLAVPADPARVQVLIADQQAIDKDRTMNARSGKAATAPVPWGTVLLVVDLAITELGMTSDDLQDAANEVHGPHRVGDKSASDTAHTMLLHYVGHMYSE